MATSKKTGREYQSRHDRGFSPTRRTYKPVKYPKVFDRWGQPTTCGVIGADGKECLRPVSGIDPRCEYHQRLQEESRGQRGGRA